MGQCCLCCSSRGYTDAYPDDDLPPTEWVTSPDIFRSNTYNAEDHEFRGEASVQDWKDWSVPRDADGQDGGTFSGPEFKAARDALENHDDRLWDSIVSAGHNLRAGLDTVTIAFASVVGIEDNVRYDWLWPKSYSLHSSKQISLGRQRHDLIFNAYRALLPKYHSGYDLEHQPQKCKPLDGAVFGLMSAVDEAVSKVYNALLGSPIPLKVVEAGKSTVQHLGTAGPDGEEFQRSVEKFYIDKPVPKATPEMMTEIKAASERILSGEFDEAGKEAYASIVESRDSGEIVSIDYLLVLALNRNADFHKAAKTALSPHGRYKEGPLKSKSRLEKKLADYDVNVPEIHMKDVVRGSCNFKSHDAFGEGYKAAVATFGEPEGCKDRRALKTHDVLLFFRYKGFLVELQLHFEETNALKSISHIAYDLDRLRVREARYGEHPYEGWAKSTMTYEDMRAELEDYRADRASDEPVQLCNSGLDDVFKYSRCGFDDKAEAIKCMLDF